MYRDIAVSVFNDEIDQDLMEKISERIKQVAKEFHVKSIEALVTSHPILSRRDVNQVLTDIEQILKHKGEEKAAEIVFRYIYDYNMSDTIHCYR